MIKYPEAVKIDDTIYKIRTDFRVAIRCNDIAEDETISKYERPLAIICTLFGPEALDNPSHYEKLLEYAKKYLSCGKEIKKSHEKPDMDYNEDMDYIEASFMSDYRIDLSNEEMHWWKFNKLINGLSNSEMGGCCVLNRVRNLRNFDTKTIKDQKERRRIEKMQKEVALKKNEKKKITEQQKESFNELMNILNIRKE